MRLSPVIFPLLLAASAASAQQAAGFKNEYIEDYNITARHLLQLAEAIPDAKYAWRPGEGVRSTSEVFVHIATGNFLLLSLTGVKQPAEYFPSTGPAVKDTLQAIFAQMQRLEKTVTSKDQVVKMLRFSLDSVRDHFSSASPGDLDKPVDFFGEKSTVRRVYMRIIAHVNEHYGQSIAYARINGIAPPWSKAEK
jgi:uncharacterized damage-inducible protein DinB